MEREQVHFTMQLRELDAQGKIPLYKRKQLNIWLKHYKLKFIYGPILL